MKILRAVNPNNTLFGRIFIMFWLSVIIMMLGTFTVARMIGQSWDVNPVSDDKLKSARNVAGFLQRQLVRGSDVRRALRRVDARFGLQVMAYDVERRKLEVSFPRHLMLQEKRFIGLAGVQSPLFVQTANMEFIGPIAVSTGERDYQVFIGRILRPDQRPVFMLGVAIAAFVILGTLACALITLSIVKPIKRLGDISDQFALGNINQTDEKLSMRKDALGQLYQHIVSMASKLAKSAQQQRALMANVSHELRTPLTRMQLALALLESQKNMGNENAKRIEKEIGVMDQLIGQALQLAEMESPQQAPHEVCELYDLDTLLSPIMTDLSFEANAREKSLLVGNIPIGNINAYCTYFSSAVENVTRNALKYCESKVKVSFSLESALELNRASKAELNTASIHGFLHIQIEDDGAGMSPDYYTQIFEPFFRVPNTASTQASTVKGTGLGLTIAKAAVDVHGGQIRACQSELGGLSMSLYFPMAKA